MAALISKPGLTNAASLAIPKQWDATWYRGHISNLLQGADVRNAVGTGGIVISGNIASPYATIGFGAPVTLPGRVTITAPNPPDVALVVNAASGKDAIDVFAPAGQAATLSLAGNGATAANGFQLSQSAAGVGTISNNGGIWVTVDGSGRWVFNAPTAGAQSNFTFNGRNGNNVVAIVQAAGAGSAFGVMIQAGTTSADYALLVQSQGGGATYFQIRGDGAIAFHGATPQAASSGYGTPTAASLTTNFPGTGATLAQCGGMLSTLILYFKALGLLAV